MDVFTVADLFLIGLALDLAGAFILARGILGSPSIIVVASTSFWNSNPLLGVQGAEDRVDGRFGVGVLLSGFTLQAVGYFLDLALSPSETTGICEALVALSMAVVAGGFAMLAWRVARPRLMKETLIEMARFEAKRVNEPPARSEHPSAERLAWYGRTWRQDGREGESDEDYAARVFGVTQFAPPEDPTSRSGQDPS
jgi:hypothetical protein